MIPSSCKSKKDNKWQPQREGNGTKDTPNNFDLGLVALQRDVKNPDSDIISLVLAACAVRAPSKPRYSYSRSPKFLLVTGIALAIASIR